MFKFALPAILVAIAVAAFFMFSIPLYNEISTLKEQTASFNQALDNSKALESARDVLTQKYNAISPEDIQKLEKLLPDNVDNIRLILEIEKIASPYGMVLKDVKYDSTKKVDTVKDKSAAVVLGGVSGEEVNREYGTWELEFGTEGIYNNFILFLKDLESNLRVVDISSIEFSSDSGQGLKMSSVESYKYTFKIKTYWLKN